MAKKDKGFDPRWDVRCPLVIELGNYSTRQCSRRIGHSGKCK